MKNPFEAPSQENTASTAERFRQKELREQELAAERKEAARRRVAEKARRDRGKAAK